MAQTASPSAAFNPFLRPPPAATALNPTPTYPPPPGSPTTPRRWWRRRTVWLLAPVALPLLGLLLLAAALALFGANWARGPLERLVQQQTGRALHIGGDLRLGLGWPRLRLQTGELRFANPAWATQPQLLEVDTADIQIDLPALLRGTLLLPVVRVGQPVVMLEQAADGRQSWLLDRAQSDASTAVQIGRLSLRQGQLGYDDPGRQTRLRLQLETAGDRREATASSTLPAPKPGPTSGLGARSDVLFSASGTWRGLPLQASGRGASVLGLRDETAPYPLLVEARIGPTTLRADGRITGLSRLTAADLQLALRGGNLAELAPLLGLGQGLPATGAYATSGHLVHQGRVWHYQGFSGKVGRSDVAGDLLVDLGRTRPMVRGALTSRLLDLADLGPVIGLRAAAPVAAAAAAGADAATGRRRVLPDLPLTTTRWRQFDVDLQLQARHVLRAQDLPLERGAAHLRLQDGLLTLDALDIGAAGGQISGSIVLDARPAELQASASLRARGLQLGQLFPAAERSRANVGRIHGMAELRGRGASVGRMLASADGELKLVAEPGRISRLLMEQMGLHLLEILQLSVTGDQPVVLGCAVADFRVQAGVMTARALALDTAVSSVVGSGQIDLARETLDLTLVPRSRNTSLVALRGPIHLHGPLAAPEVSLDTPGILARGAGALALGLVNPLLALLPLVETGKNPPSPCAKAAAAAGLSAPAAAAASAPAPRAAPAAPRNGTRAGTAPPAPPPSRP